MSHAPKLNALEALADDALSPAGRARIERHLATCETCRAALKVVQTYAQMRDDARAHPSHEASWERLEQALDRGTLDPVESTAATVREKSAPKRTGGRWVALAWPVLAVAATALIAWIGISGQQQEATRVQPPRTTFAAQVKPTETVKEPDLLGATIALVTGNVERERAGVRTAVSPGDALSEHDVLHTAAGAEIHVVLADGSAFALFADSELALENLRETDVLLGIRRGEVLSEVHALAADARFVVAGSEFSSHVRGTRFTVSERKGFAVEVHEGRVEIMHGDASVTLLDAGQHWSSTPDAATGNGHAGHVYGRTALKADWPELDLPADARIVSWQLGDALVPGSAGLRMRAPLGEQTLTFVDRKGTLHTVVVTLLAEGAQLNEGDIDKALGQRKDAIGYLPPEQISPVVHDGLDRLRRCYERALRQDPKLESKLTLAIRVGADGHVARAELNGEGVAAELQQCVLMEAKGWHFPRPQGGGGVAFEVPLNFKPRQ